MDRIVWLIVLTVVANFILEYSGVWAQTKDSQSYGPPTASYRLPQQRLANNVNPDDVELVDPMQTSPSENNGRAARNKLFDNIFKVLTILFIFWLFEFLIVFLRYDEINSIKIQLSILFSRYQFPHLTQSMNCSKASAERLAPADNYCLPFAPILIGRVELDEIMPTIDLILDLYPSISLSFSQFDFFFRI